MSTVTTSSPTLRKIVSKFETILLKMARFITIETNRLGAYVAQYHGGRPLIRAIAVLANIIIRYVLLTIL